MPDLRPIEDLEWDEPAPRVDGRLTNPLAGLRGEESSNGPRWVKPVAVGLVLALVAAGGWWFNRNELSSLQAELDRTNAQLEAISSASAARASAATITSTGAALTSDQGEPEADIESATPGIEAVADDLTEAFRYLDDLALRQQDVESIVRRSPDFDAVQALLKESVVYVETEYATGSGFRIDVAAGCDEGPDCELYDAAAYDTMVVTNYHVVSELASLDYADRTVVVRARDGSSVEGRLWKWDVTNDLAAIDLNSSGFDTYLAPLLWASPGATAVGDQVAVGGHPFGLGFMMSTGTITARNDSSWQLNAIVSQGSSGGPVVDAFGRVVGVATSSLGGMTYATDITMLCEQFLDC